MNIEIIDHYIFGCNEMQLINNLEARVQSCFHPTNFQSQDHPTTSDDVSKHNKGETKWLAAVQPWQIRKVCKPPRPKIVYLHLDVMALPSPASKFVQIHFLRGPLSQKISTGHLQMQTGSIMKLFIIMDLWSMEVLCF